MEHQISKLAPTCSRGVNHFFQAIKDSGISNPLESTFLFCRFLNRPNRFCKSKRFLTIDNMTSNMHQLLLAKLKQKKGSIKTFKPTSKHQLVTAKISELSSHEVPAPNAYIVSKFARIFFTAANLSGVNLDFNKLASTPPFDSPLFSNSPINMPVCGFKTLNQLTRTLLGKYISQLRDSGHSPTEIARTLGLSNASVYRVLKASNNSIDRPSIQSRYTVNRGSSTLVSIMHLVNSVNGLAPHLPFIFQSIERIIGFSSAVDAFKRINPLILQYQDERCAHKLKVILNSKLAVQNELKHGSSFAARQAGQSSVFMGYARPRLRAARANHNNILGR